MASNEKETGKVKFFKPESGYGFIQRDNGGEDLFFHTSQVSGQELKKGDDVEFNVGEGKKGPCANDVSYLDL